MKGKPKLSCTNCQWTGSGSVAIDDIARTVHWAFCAHLFWIRRIYFATCVGILSGPINHRYSLNSMSGDYPLKFKSIFFMTLIREPVGVWDKALFRNRCSGAPGDQGSNPLMSIVGWLYTRYGATVASHGPRDLLQERELGRVGWGTVFVDIGIGPIFLSRRKRQMKCGMMGNWCCSDSARCPCLRSHWVNCLAPPCWIGNVLHTSGCWLYTG